MLSARAHEELHGYAEAGRLGGQIELALVPELPRLGDRAFLHWDCSGSGHRRANLHLPQERRVQVPSAGQLEVLINADPFIARLVTASEETQIEVAPEVPQPSIQRLVVPKKATLGE